MSISCPECQSKNHIKNGLVWELQRYRCQFCFCNFIHGDAATNVTTKLEIWL